MPLWMASRGYSLIQQNSYPTAVYAMGIIGTFIYCHVSDRLRSRWQASLYVVLTHTAFITLIPICNTLQMHRFHIRHHQRHPGI